MRVRGGKLLFAVVLLGPLIAPAAFAQEPPLRLTLDEALARADQNSPRIAGLRAHVDAAIAGEAAVVAARRPSLAVLGGYTRTNHVEEYALSLPGEPARVLYPDVPDNYRARLDLQWPIYTSGRTPALRRAAASARDAAAFDVAAARADVRLETTRAFWALVTARETEGVLQRALESADAHVAELQSRLNQGLIAPNEVLSAEAQRSHQRVLAIDAAGLRRIAEADVRRLLGDQSGRVLEPVGNLDAVSIAQTLQEGGGQRPERQAAASRVAAAEAREAAAAAGARPQVAVAGGFDYARPNPRIFPRSDVWHDSWDVALNVSWSLWDGGRRRAEQAEAAAATTALRARAAEIDREIAFEVSQRGVELESARAAIVAAEDGARAAREARRVVGERFAVGVATSTDVLDAQTAVLQAELDRTRALATAQLALARLERARGR